MNVDQTLTLKEYADLFTNLSLPSEEQMSDFADYVSGADSWYKHLPAIPPGADFFFYLDPAAGYSQILKSNGRIEIRELHGKGFHYADLPTKEYRERFGNLAYSCRRGTSVSLVSAKGESTIQPDKNRKIRTADGQAYELPQEIIRTGYSQHTSAIYKTDFMGNVLMILMIMDSYWQDLTDGNWSADPVGMKAVEKLMVRRAVLIEESKIETIKDIGSDVELLKLLNEERNRQLGSMINAMKAVVQLVNKYHGT